VAEFPKPELQRNVQRFWCGKYKALLKNIQTAG